MSNSITVGTKVKHDYSGYHGEVLAIRRSPQGYNYKVAFQTPEKTITDWYKREVLELL